MRIENTNEHVDKADVFYAVYALAMTSAIMMQSLIYPRGTIGD